MVPVVWDRNLPDTSFVLLSSSLTPEGATPEPGVWQGPHRLGGVVLANLTEEECYLERGQVLARGVVDPTDAEEVMASWSQGAAVAVADFDAAEPTGSPVRDAVPPAALACPEAPVEMVPELQRLGGAPGWGKVHGEPALVARRAQARRIPEPRYSRDEYPERTSYGCWGTQGGCQWKCLESRTSYRTGRRPRTIFGFIVPLLVTVFHAAPGHSPDRAVAPIGVRMASLAVAPAGVVVSRVAQAGEPRTSRLAFPMSGTGNGHEFTEPADVPPGMERGAAGDPRPLGPENRRGRQDPPGGNATSRIL